MVSDFGLLIGCFFAKNLWVFLTILLAISHDGMRRYKIQVSFDLIIKILNIDISGMTDNNLDDFLKLIKCLLVQA
jgi:hypothetical protein